MERDGVLAPTLERCVQAMVNIAAHRSIDATMMIAEQRAQGFMIGSQHQLRPTMRILENKRILSGIQHAEQGLLANKGMDNFINALAAAGVAHVHTYICDGSSCYYGKGFFHLVTKAQYPTTEISDEPDVTLLRCALVLHNSGVTDRRTFLRQAADAGVDAFQLDVSTCRVTYMDSQGTVLLMDAMVPSAAQLN